MNLFDYLSDSLPTDHCRQTRAMDQLRDELSRGFLPKNVLDFGCGDGRTRSAIDGFTLMERTYRGRPKEFDRFPHEESPRNVEIEQTARSENKSVRVINYRKLLFAGSFTFVACAVDRANGISQSLR